MITANPHPPVCRSPPMAAGVLGVAIPLSMAAHALVFAAVLLMAVSLGGPGDPPAAVMVDFVTVAPVEAPEEPAAAPDPEPEPPPPPAPAPAEPVPVAKPPKPPKPLSDRRHTPPARMVSAAPVSERPSLVPVAEGRAPANAIRDYGAAVWARISRHKPRGLSLRGVVTVTFALSTEGSLESATVSHSSGVSALDQASLDAVRASAPFPQPPTGATTSQLVFTITFEYQ